MIASHSGGGSGSDIWSRRDRVASMRPNVSRMHTTWGQNRSERHTRPLDQTGSDIFSAGGDVQSDTERVPSKGELDVGESLSSSGPALFAHTANMLDDKRHTAWVDAVA